MTTWPRMGEGALDPRLRRERRSRVAADPELWGLDRAERRPDLESGNVVVALHFLVSEVAWKSAIPPRLANNQILIGGAGKNSRAAERFEVDPTAPHVLIVEFPPSSTFAEAGDIGAVARIVDNVHIDPLFDAAYVALAPPGGASRDPAGAPALEEAPAPSGVNYLAKDYAAYRQLMLDQMAAVYPDWRERHPADLGVAMVEILAYAADSLSYYQDAVATEAYLQTARQRVSLRRHARLLDFAAHEGCAARVWAQIRVLEPTKIRAGLKLICGAPASPSRDVAQVASLSYPPTDGAAVFETMVDAMLDSAWNDLAIYDWGMSDYQLEAGAESVVLEGWVTGLGAGAVLILADAQTQDPVRRHAVRLIGAPRFTRDPIAGAQLTLLNWGHADALPFALPVVASRGGEIQRRLATVHGNIVPADAGFTLADPPFQISDFDVEPATVPLLRPGLTFAAPYAPSADAPASDFGRIDPIDAAPRVWLRERDDDGADHVWQCVPDLLGAVRFARVFVAEMDNDGFATLRFGDDRGGRAPDPGATLRATYRVRAQEENVGANAITTWAPRPDEDYFIDTVCNLLPAVGGSAPMAAEQIRVRAPEAFRDNQRCVVAGDFAAAVRRDARVRDAVAAEKWTGSWNTVFVHVWPVAEVVDAEGLFDDLTEALAPSRIIGSDYRIVAPAFAPVYLRLSARLKTPFVLAVAGRNMRARLHAKYGSGQLSFGGALYLSAIIAEAMAEPGVTDVVAQAFQRRGEFPRGELQAGVMIAGPTEILCIEEPLGRIELHLAREVT